MTAARLCLWFGVGAVAAVSAVNLHQAFQRVRPPPRVPGGPPHVVLRLEERLAPVRRALEQRGVRGVVGYVCDLPPERMPHDHRSMEEYFASQFALVPWVLETDPAKVTWAVTNLRETVLPARLPTGYRVAEDFGGGVALLGKVAP